MVWWGPTNNNQTSWSDEMRNHGYFLRCNFIDTDNTALQDYAENGGDFGCRFRSPSLSPYHPSAVHFGGLGQATSTGNLISAPSSRGFISFWFRYPNNAATFTTIFNQTISTTSIMNINVNALTFNTAPFQISVSFGDADNTNDYQNNFDSLV